MIDLITTHPAAVWIALGAIVMVAIALTMTVRNLALLRARGVGSGRQDDHVSVCIPARNESANIEACAVSFLASEGVRVEVVMYDDQSTDETPRIIRDLCQRDPRVRLAEAVSLPRDWNGKQHACWRASRSAAGNVLLFVDADVRVTATGVRDALSLLRSPAAHPRGLVSVFPRQETGTLGERLVVPMMYFLLLSYLPMGRMRRTLEPSASAGCGQFMMFTREAYDAIGGTQGGHAACKASMHDGVLLPRAVRRAGFGTDLLDGTGVASCRMYRNFAQSWRGFAKNAYEGLGSPVLLVFLTALHFFAHLLPCVAVVVAALKEAWFVGGLWAIACVVPMVQRAYIARATRTSAAGAFLHPVTIAIMTAIQWHSFVLHVSGRRTWKGRPAALVES